MSVVLVYVYAFLFALVMRFGDTYCPSNGVVPENSELYQCLVVSNDALSWLDAIYTCEIYGGSLVKIETEDQRWYIQENIINGEYYWIGLNDLEREGQFVWPDRIRFDPKTYWRPLQPNGKERSQNCVVTGSQGWEEKTCTDKYKYICQIDSDMAPETTISIPKEAKLSTNRIDMIRPGSWNDRALMVSLSAEDEAICALYCLYTETCVRVSYRTDKENINCLLYREAVGYEAPLWRWRVYERTADDKTATTSEETNSEQ